MAVMMKLMILIVSIVFILPAPIIAQMDLNSCGKYLKIVLKFRQILQDNQSLGKTGYLLHLICLRRSYMFVTFKDETIIRVKRGAKWLFR